MAVLVLLYFLLPQTTLAPHITRSAPMPLRLCAIGARLLNDPTTPDEFTSIDGRVHGVVIEARCEPMT